MCGICEVAAVTGTPHYGGVSRCWVAVSDWLPCPGHIRWRKSLYTQRRECWAQWGETKRLLLPGTEPNTPASNESCRDYRKINREDRLGLLEFIFWTCVGGKAGRAVKLTTYHPSVSRLRMSTAKRLLPRLAFTTLTSTTLTSVGIFEPRTLQHKYNVGSTDISN